MEVIKKGKKPEDKSCDWKCKRCNSVVRAKQSEGRQIHDQRDGDSVVLNCPECGIENWICNSLFK